MKGTLLLAGFMSLSLMAVGQSSDKQQAPAANHEVKSPRDAASGQASGKRMQAGDSAQQPDAARDAATGQASGKRSQQADSSSSSTQGPRVATGDVTGDGAADQSMGNGPRQTTSTDSSVTKQAVVSPRDAASGQASGKRMHKPVTVSMETDKAAADNTPAPKK